MVRPALFAALFATASAGLANLLLTAAPEAPAVASPEAVTLPAVASGPPEPVVEAALPALQATPQQSLASRVDAIARLVAEDASYPDDGTGLFPVGPVEAEVEVDPDAASIALVLDFFDGRHTGLTNAEIEAVAQTIVSEARFHELDVELVLAVIRIESAGYAFAVSSVGALGLMQIMPPTGQELAEKEGIAWRGEDTLFDPQINVRLGVRYLEQLAQRYDGHIPTALAAYNWGPGRIDGFLRRGTTLPVRYSKAVLEAYAALETPRSS